MRKLILLFMVLAMSVSLNSCKDDDDAPWETVNDYLGMIRYRADDGWYIGEIRTTPCSAVVYIITNVEEFPWIKENEDKRVKVSGEMKYRSGEMTATGGVVDYYFKITKIELLPDPEQNPE